MARRKDLEDHPIPSGNAAAALGLLRLAALTGEHAYEDRAVGVLRLLHPIAARHPHAFSHLLQALDFHLGPVREVALAGEDTARARARVRARSFAPIWCWPAASPTACPLLEGRGPVDGQRGRLRVRGLRLPAAGHRARRAAGAAGLSRMGLLLAASTAEVLLRRRGPSAAEWPAGAHRVRSRSPPSARGRPRARGERRAHRIGPRGFARRA